MKMYRVFLLLALALSLTTTAMAQDEFGSDYGDDDEDDDSGSRSTVQANVSSDGDISGDAAGYPGFSLGSKLEMVSTNRVSSALVEANLDIISRLSAFVLFGMAFNTIKVTDDDNDGIKQRSGAIVLAAGARFNFRDPAPEHAHLYVSADLGVAIGMASDEIDGDSQGDAEDSAKEAADLFFFGSALGIEYLFVPEFSIAPEIGFKYVINRDEDNAIYDGANIDKAYESWLATSFALRFTYHF